MALQPFMHACYAACYVLNYCSRSITKRMIITVYVLVMNAIYYWKGVLLNELDLIISIIIFRVPLKSNKGRECELHRRWTQDRTFILTRLTCSLYLSICFVFSCLPWREEDQRSMVSENNYSFSFSNLFLLLFSGAYSLE